MNMLVGLGTTMVIPKLMKNLQDQKVNVRHASPGRVRLQCDKWKNEPTARNLVTLFEQMPIVKTVNTSPITGSLLLKFNTETLTAEQFDEIVKSAVETSIETYSELPSNLKTAMRSSVSTVDNTLKKQSGGNVDLESAMSVFLIISGILRVTTNPVFASTLIYWAYSLIMDDRR